MGNAHNNACADCMRRTKCPHTQAREASPPPCARGPGSQGTSPQAIDMQKRTSAQSDANTKVAPPVRRHSTSDERSEHEARLHTCIRRPTSAPQGKPTQRAHLCTPSINARAHATQGGPRKRRGLQHEPLMKYARNTHNRCNRGAPEMRPLEGHNTCPRCEGPHTRSRAQATQAETCNYNRTLATPSPLERKLLLRAHTSLTDASRHRPAPQRKQHPTAGDP